MPPLRIMLDTVCPWLNPFVASVGLAWVGSGVKSSMTNTSATLSGALFVVLLVFGAAAGGLAGLGSGGGGGFCK